MYKILLCILLIHFLCPAHVLAAEDKMFYAAPSRLPGTENRMDTAGYWINRHPSPDQVILTPQEIDVFNSRVRDELKLAKDIFAITVNFKTESLMKDFNANLANFSERGYYTADGIRFDAAFMEKIRQNMNLSGVVLGIAPRYGLAVRYTDVRFLPTEQGLYESLGDIDFDQLQNSTLDIGTPVAVVHQSADKKWYYVLTALCDGWVEADRIALGDVKTVRDFVQAKTFGVAITPKADIFLNEDMTRHYDYVRMGTRLALVGASSNEVSILLPTMDKDGKLQMVQGYMDSADIHEGYLPYTPRVIYTQAFAMLNQPYGWGGMYGQQDCSAFLDEVFATVGIVLPRDSKDQAQAGQVSVLFDIKNNNEQKVQALKGVLGATALLPMKGHIMLYLGMEEGRPYAIHAIWAFRERKGSQDIVRVINRVVVSSLSLGEGSYKGSLLERLSSVVEIK